MVSLYLCVNSEDGLYDICTVQDHLKLGQISTDTRHQNERPLPVEFPKKATRTQPKRLKRSLQGLFWKGL